MWTATIGHLCTALPCIRNFFTKLSSPRFPSSMQKTCGVSSVLHPCCSSALQRLTSPSNYTCVSTRRPLFTHSFAPLSVICAVFQAFFRTAVFARIVLRVARREISHVRLSPRRIFAEVFGPQASGTSPLLFRPSGAHWRQENCRLPFCAAPPLRRPRQSHLRS